jgi:hypothetical protein
MCPFQMIAQIMIATSVVNCAPVQGMPGLAIYIPRLLNIWPMDHPKKEDFGKSHWVPGGGIGVDCKLSLDSPQGMLAEPANRTDKTVWPADNPVNPAESSIYDPFDPSNINPVTAESLSTSTENKLNKGGIVLTATIAALTAGASVAGAIEEGKKKQYV